jgi:hypothetical protein
MMFCASIIRRGSLAFQDRPLLAALARRVGAHFFTGRPTFVSTEEIAAVNRPVRSA